jgi:hypothetical protein
MTTVDVRLVGLVAAAIVTAALWAAALLLGRVDAKVTARGFRNGVLIAAGLFAVTVVIVTFVYNGRAVFVDTLDLAGAFELGLIVGAVVAIGYLWLGAVLIAIGLIFRSKPQWSTLGAWAAVPVIVVSLGFGYVSYRSVNAEGKTDSSANGTLSIELSTPGQDEPLTTTGAASCASDAAGTFTIHAGTAAEPQIVTDDGRLVSVQITLSTDAPQAALAMSIAGLDLSNMSTETAAGSGAASGQIKVTAAPLSGTVTWACSG